MKTITIEEADIRTCKNCGKIWNGDNTHHSISSCPKCGIKGSSYTETSRVLNYELYMDFQEQKTVLLKVHRKICHEINLLDTKLDDYSLEITLSDGYTSERISMIGDLWTGFKFEIRRIAEKIKHLQKCQGRIRWYFKNYLPKE